MSSISKSKCNLLIFAERHNDAAASNLLMSAFNLLKNYGFHHWLFEYEDKSFENVYKQIKLNIDELESLASKGFVIYYNHNYLLRYYKSTIQMFDMVSEDETVKSYNVDEHYLQLFGNRDLAMSREIKDLCDQGKDKLLLLVGIRHYDTIAKLLDQDFNILTVMSFGNPPVQEKEIGLLHKDEVEVFYGASSVEAMVQYEAVYNSLRRMSGVIISDQRGNKILPLDFYLYPSIDVNEIVRGVYSAFSDEEL